jgi:hypothetical protein
MAENGYKTQSYERIAVASLEDVLPLIGEALDAPQKKDRVNVAGVMVHVTSLRLRTFFKSGTYCHHCGLQAKYFAVERTPDKNSTDKPYHLNLWGEDANGEPVLFTHDHIVARALGGAPNSLENTQTSCGPCNWEKGLLEGEQAKTDPVAIALRQAKADQKKGRKTDSDKRRADRYDARRTVNQTGDTK